MYIDNVILEQSIVATQMHLEIEGKKGRVSN